MVSLHDAYELGGVAGHGRTTLVRLAVRRGDCRPVALKQLRMEHSFDSDKRASFIQQYRRAAMLEHDNIETLLDLVEGPDGPVAVSDWVDGRSLLRLTRWRREQQESWEPREVIAIARSLLEALRYAHNQPTGLDAQGMLHGGLWPGNVLIDTDGHVTLVDFGMAAVWQEAPEPWQDLEALRYLSADHARHGATAASDLYAVGAIVHELLSGQLFRGECETETEMRAALDRAEPPPRPEGDYPAGLEQLRHRLLEPVPSPRLALEHMLDLCAGIPSQGGRDLLSAMVRRALRSDTTSPGLEDEAASRDSSVGDVLDGIARVRGRSSAAAHVAAGRLEQVPLGGPSRGPRARDTQSVPIPVDHEETAARHPMYLGQTAPPQGEQTRSAESRRSGMERMPDDDTAPLPLGPGEDDPEADPEADLSSRELPSTRDEAPEPGVPSPVPRRVYDLIEDPDITAEVTKVPQLPEDLARADARARARANAEAKPDATRPSWLHGPIGWALLGAAAVGIGLPLLARCATDPGPTSSPPKASSKR